jgi:hypothetical protein
MRLKEIEEEKQYKKISMANETLFSKFRDSIINRSKNLDFRPILISYFYIVFIEGELMFLTISRTIQFGEWDLFIIAIKESLE